MNTRINNRTFRLIGLVLLPLLVLPAGCDSTEPGDPGVTVGAATAEFSDMNYWPAHSENITCAGRLSYRFRSERNGSDDYRVAVRAENLSARFDGTASGESGEYYLHVWDGEGELLSEFNGAVGSKQSFAESFRLVGEHTGEEAEGLVVTEATIGKGGRLTFEVKEIIALP